ncbi:MAG: hypothetical protein QM726_06675 [Chitinophagaceae bacterium]
MKSKRRAIALKNYRGLSNAAFLDLGRTVIKFMSSNADFPNPVPSIKDVEAGFNNFEEAFMQGKTGEKAKIENRKILHSVAAGLLDDLVDYVNFTAKGNRAKLAGTGFAISADTIIAATNTSTPPATAKMP